MNTGIMSSVMCLMMLVVRVERFVLGGSVGMQSVRRVKRPGVPRPQFALCGGGGGTRGEEPGGIPTMGMWWTEFQAKGSL